MLGDTDKRTYKIRIIAVKKKLTICTYVICSDWVHTYAIFKSEPGVNEESLSQFSNSSGGAHDPRWTHRKPLDSHEMNDTYILIPRTKGKELGFFLF